MTLTDEQTRVDGVAARVHHPNAKPSSGGKDGRGPMMLRLTIPEVVAAVVVAILIGLGAYFVGRNSGPSDGEIKARIDRAVGAERSAARSRQSSALDRQQNRLQASFEKKAAAQASAAYEEGVKQGSTNAKKDAAKGLEKWRDAICRDRGFLC